MSEAPTTPNVPGAWRCPSCGASVEAKGPWRPFCSERCKMVDLGGWFLGRYRVPVVPLEGEEEAVLPPAHPDDPDTDL